MVINRDCSFVGMPAGAHFRVLSEHGMGFVLAEKLDHYGYQDTGHEVLGQLPRYVIFKPYLSPCGE